MLPRATSTPTASSELPGQSACGYVVDERTGTWPKSSVKVPIEMQWMQPEPPLAVVGPSR